MKSDDLSIALNISLPRLTKDINTLEEVCLEITRQLLVKVLAALDDWLYESRPAGLVVVGKRKRTLSTRVGDIVIWRRLCQQRVKNDPPVTD